MLRYGGQFTYNDQIIHVVNDHQGIRLREEKNPLDIVLVPYFRKDDTWVLWRLPAATIAPVTVSANGNAVTSITSPPYAKRKSPPSTTFPPVGASYPVALKYALMTRQARLHPSSKTLGPNSNVLYESVTQSVSALSPTAPVTLKFDHGCSLQLAVAKSKSAKRLYVECVSIDDPAVSPATARTLCAAVGHRERWAALHAQQIVALETGGKLQQNIGFAQMHRDEEENLKKNLKRAREEVTKLEGYMAVTKRRRVKAESQIEPTKIQLAAIALHHEEEIAKLQTDAGLKKTYTKMVWLE